MTNVALIDMCCFEGKILISIVNSEDNRMWVTFDALLPIQGYLELRKRESTIYSISIGREENIFG